MTRPFAAASHSRKLLNVLRCSATVGLSLLALYVMFRSVNINLMEHMLLHAQFVYLLPIGAAFLVRYWLRALRWQRLVGHIGQVSLPRAFDRVVICQAADRILPGQLSYPVTVQVAAAKFDLRHCQLFGTDLIERMMDGAVYALFLLLSIITLPIGAAYAGITGFLIVGTMLGLALSWWLTRRPADRRVPRRLPGAGLLRQFLEGMESIQNGRRTMLLFAVSLAIWVTEVGLYQLVAVALGITLNPLVCIFLVAMANTGAAVPLMQAAVGFIFVAQRILVWSGHSASMAVTYASTLELLLLVSVVLLAPACAYRLRLSLGDLIPARRRQPVPAPVLVSASATDPRFG